MAKFKWTVEIEVDEQWVADGFELTTARLHDVIAHTLPYAFGHEFGGKVLKSPDPEAIALAQGYKSAADKAAKERR